MAKKNIAATIVPIAIVGGGLWIAWRQGIIPKVLGEVGIAPGAAHPATVGGTQTSATTDSGSGRYAPANNGVTAAGLKAATDKNLATAIEAAKKGNGNALAFLVNRHPEYANLPAVQAVYNG